MAGINIFFRRKRIAENILFSANSLSHRESKISDDLAKKLDPKNYIFLLLSLYSLYILIAGYIE